MFMKIPELIALVVIIVLILNIILLALGKISVWLFFLILLIGALIAYKGIPYLRKVKGL